MFIALFSEAMSPPKNTVFRDDFLVNCPGVIRGGKVDTEAHCILSNKTIQLSSIGVEAKSHISGVKHGEKAGGVKQTADIRSFTSSVSLSNAVSYVKNCRLLLIPGCLRRGR